MKKSKDKSKKALPANVISLAERRAARVTHAIDCDMDEDCTCGVHGEKGPASA